MIYAGFCRRAVAFILDMIIVTIPTTLIFGPMVAVGTLALGANPADISAMQAGLVGATLVSWQLVPS